MFTIQQINEAHAKVKSGADFPQYFKDIMQLGVTDFETFVKDSQTIYHGSDGYEIASPPMYPSLDIASECDKIQFLQDLKIHQQGGTDYMTFCKDCAKSGIHRWRLDMANKTCTYFDVIGNEVLVETIPVP